MKINIYVVRIYEMFAVSVQLHVLDQYVNCIFSL